MQDLPLFPMLPDNEFQDWTKINSVAENIPFPFALLLNLPRQAVQKKL
jgi:hypothetical protein